MLYDAQERAHLDGARQEELVVLVEAPVPLLLVVDEDLLTGAAVRTDWSRHQHRLLVWQSTRTCTEECSTWYVLLGWMMKVCTWVSLSALGVTVAFISRLLPFLSVMMEWTCLRHTPVSPAQVAAVQSGCTGAQMLAQAHGIRTFLLKPQTSGPCMMLYGVSPLKSGIWSLLHG